MFRKYLLRNYFNFFSLDPIVTEEMKYEKQERSPKCHLKSAKEIFSAADSEDRTKLLSLTLLRAHSFGNYLQRTHALPDTVLGN